jgi:hypothetical protein
MIQFNILLDSMSKIIKMEHPEIEETESKDQVKKTAAFRSHLSKITTNKEAEKRYKKLKKMQEKHLKEMNSKKENK